MDISRWSGGLSSSHHYIFLHFFFRFVEFQKNMWVGFAYFAAFVLYNFSLLNEKQKINRENFFSLLIQHDHERCIPACTCGYERRYRFSVYMYKPTF